MSDALRAQSDCDDVDLFCGALNPAVARVYARWGNVERADCALCGTFTGPSCEYAATLPAVARFVDRGPGGPPLAEAIVPEPSFWTPEMPQLYQAELDLLAGGRVVARAERLFGIRRLGVAERRLRWEGRNWVLRGVSLEEERVGDLGPWHDTNTALVVRRPSELLCEAASRRGVLLVAELAEPDLEEIRRLSRWPAVGFAILPTGCDFDARAVVHNLVLAERISADAGPSAWAAVAICDIADPQAWTPPPVSLPIVAQRRGRAAGAAAGRVACDQLQAALAPAGLLAGYIC